jgi:RHS repeat-associated protein
VSRRAPSRLLIGFVALAVLGSGVVATPATAQPLHISRPTTAPVPGKHIKRISKPVVPKSSVSARPLVVDPPAAQSASMLLTSGWQNLGSTGIMLAGAGAVSASIVGATAAKQNGLKGLVMKLSSTATTAAPVEVKIPTSVLAASFGADYASRVRWVQVDSPLRVLKDLLAKSAVSAVPSSQAEGALVVSPTVGKKQILLVAIAGASSTAGTGSFAATPLKPSSSWDVSLQTGGFSWSYPMRTPPSAAGPSPSLALEYDSQSVDGETGSTNNQPNAVGDGWALSGGGFIEQNFVGCSQDTGPSGAVAASGDLCWKTENASISVAGHSGQLVKDQKTGVWKLQSDDGSRIEHLVGAAQGCAGSNGTYDDDCWRMTTTDGTQYYFGLDKLPGWVSGSAATNSAFTVPVFGNDPGEPCHASSFNGSACAQAWRWNLDYVVDTHSNAEALYYDRETNYYSQNGTTAVSYTRGGQLDHIDYGLKASAVFVTNAATDRVTFSYDSNGRCSDSTGANCSQESVSGGAVAPEHPSYYPDVPFDQLCTGGSCPTLISPTFWSVAMLTSISTLYFDQSASSYSPVDSWAISHSFPTPGDGSSAALWLTQVVHTGVAHGASIAEPATVFTASMMQNRVWALDGLSALDKNRLTSLRTSTGAVVSVNYSSAECTPQNEQSVEANASANTTRCFPQWWTPDTTYPRPAQIDLFNKYVVTSVVNDPMTGGGNDRPQETDYLYTGTPAWRYDTSSFTPDAQRTWSVFAGYNAIEVRVGSQTDLTARQTTDYSFYQGMNGDRASVAGGKKSVSVAPGVPDSLWLAGQTREAKVLLGVGGAVLSDTVTTPWASQPTANDGLITARFVKPGDVVTKTTLASGGTRATENKNTFDPEYGLPLTVDAITPDAGTKCTTTSYASPNLTAWLIDFPSEISVVATDCSALGSAVYPAASIGDTRMAYDKHAVGAMPTVGNSTLVEVVDSYTGKTADTAEWVASSKQAYDQMGRVVSSTDVLGHITKTAYSPAASAPAGQGALTSLTTTNSLGWVTSTTYDPAWGVETVATDQNSHKTEATYDALGRRSLVWLPLTPRDTSPNAPSIKYEYTESTAVASSVLTTTRSATNDATRVFTLYDGLGRQVQTQTDALSVQTAAISDTRYDSAGRVSFTDGPYWSNVAPSTTLWVPNDAVVPSQTVTAYDSAGRVVANVLESDGIEVSRTTTTYSGSDRVDVTPPSGGTITTTFTDSLGQKTSLVQYAGSQTETTKYGYSPRGQMTSMTDPVGNRWTWGFDVLGHQVKASDPDSGTTTSTFDDAGELLSSTDGRGKTLAYGYDGMNRKVAQYLGASANTGRLLASWTWDTLAKGQLTSSSSYVGSTKKAPGAAYTQAITGYDAAYDPTGTTTSIPNGAAAFGETSYHTDLSYFDNGQLRSQSEPEEGGLPAEKIEYSYDSAGNLASLIGISLVVGQVVYTPIHQVQGYDRIDGSVYDYTTYGYDPATGRMTDILTETANNDDSNLTTLSDETFGYDPAGNVTSQKTTGAGVATDAQCYGYDGLQNLTQAWTPASGDCGAAASASALGGPAAYWTKYTVDPATGNRLSAISTSTTIGGSTSTDSYSYPAPRAAHPHAVQSVAHVGSTASTSAYAYDAAGNTTTRPGQRLTYDAAGRVSSVTTGSTKQSNVYDASGSLLLESDAVSGSTLFLGDTELHLVPGSSTPSAVRTYSANDTPIAERDSSTTIANGTLSWLVVDQQNTAVGEIDSDTGAVTRRYTDPFGNRRGTPATWSSQHGFLNAPTSTVSSLTQLGAREYDPMLGRFLSVDSVLTPTNPQQNNGYSYAQNSPVTRDDPTGLCSTSDDSSGCWGHWAGNPEATSTGGAIAPGDTGKTPPSPTAAAYCDQWGCGANAGKAPQLDADINACVGSCRVTGELTSAERRKNRQALYDGAGFVSTVLLATCMGDFAQPICWGGAAGKGGTIALEGADDGLAAMLAAQAAKSPLAKLFSSDAPPTASSLVSFAESQGWARSQTASGPLTFRDSNGVPRMTIKSGSDRTPGSEGPHVALRNGDNERVDPFGNVVTRRSLENHTAIRMDLP